VLLLFRFSLGFQQTSRLQTHPLLVSALIANVKRRLLTGIGYGTTLTWSER
jgi:hypothetical protein